MLGPTASVGVVLGVEGSGGVEDARAVGKGAGTEDAGTCSLICTIGGGCSSTGRSAASWSSSGSEGGR